MKEFFQTLLVLSTATTLPLVIYALTSKGVAEFDLISFLLISRTRVALTAVAILLLAVVVTFMPDDAAQVLSVIGFDISESTAGVGLALSALLISGIRGDSKGGDSDA